jgi:integrase/recombinase XerD
MIIRREPRRLQSVPSREEVRKLLEQPDTETAVGIRDRAILEVLYGTGIRREELLKLKVSSVDLKENTLRVNGKGGRQRIVPLGKTAAHWLQRYIEKARTELDPSEDVEALRISQHGEPMSYWALPVIMRKYVKAVGIPSLSPHSLRRACATHMLQNGAHPVELQMLLGHASLTHLSQYLRLSISELRKTHAATKPGQ